MTRVFQIAFMVAIILFGLAFHIRNDQPVSLDFYVTKTEPVPLSWIVVIAFSTGAMLGSLVMFNTNMALRRRIRRLTKKHAMATKEIVSLRAIPINDVP